MYAASKTKSAFPIWRNNMNRIDTQRLVSWLKYLDIEYLDDAVVVELSKFDINDPQQRREMIGIAIVPEFATLNEKSKESLKEILAECKNCTDVELEGVFARVGMPFKQPLIERQLFLVAVWDVLFEGNAQG